MPLELNDGDTINVVLSQQPLKVTQGYKSTQAVVAELAMRLFANSNFERDQSGKPAKPAQQLAAEAVQRANIFAGVAGGMLEDLVVK